MDADENYTGESPGHKLASANPVSSQPRVSDPVFPSMKLFSVSVILGKGTDIRSKAAGSPDPPCWV
jgi:hypothetical protein